LRSLHRNRLGAEGAAALAPALAANGGLAGLTDLNIAVNWIKDEGITAICNAVQGNKESKLATLNVACSAISPVGATAVAAMVAVTGRLTSLDLSNNAGGITAESIAAIADALRVNGALTKLSLAWNELEKQGIKALCEALNQNLTLEELDLWPQLSWFRGGSSSSSSASDC
jgi:hypothetical protein